MQDATSRAFMDALKSRMPTFLKRVEAKKAQEKFVDAELKRLVGNKDGIKDEELGPTNTGESKE